MKKLIVSFGFLMVLMFSLSAALYESDNRFIACVWDKANLKRAAKDLRALTGGKITHIYENGVPCLSIEVPQGGLDSKTLLYLQGDIFHVEKDLKLEPEGKKTVVKTAAVSQAAQIVPKNIMRIGGLQSPTAKINGKEDVKITTGIAIVDTGVDSTHPDLNVVYSKNYTKSKSSKPVDGHGTHSAGIAAAKDNGIGVVGVAPGAPIYSLRVFNDAGVGYVSDLVKAIDYATGQYKKIGVVNLSLTLQGTSATLQAAIQKGINKGIVFVAAAGNQSNDIWGSDGVYRTKDDISPASFPEVATVSAMGDSDGKSGGLGVPLTQWTDDDTFAAFSNYSRFAVNWNPVSSKGKGMDMAAPGIAIYSTEIGGKYGWRKGTSEAAPHVSGAFALLMNRYGRDINRDGKINALDVAEFRQLLINLSEPQSQWGPNPGDPDKNKEGLLDVGGI